MINIQIKVFCLCAISCCFLAVDLDFCAAQQNDSSVGSETGTKNERMENNPWQPPAPPPDEFDWIQLTSEEWLKGELKVLYEEKLEFDISFVWDRTEDPRPEDDGTLPEKNDYYLIFSVGVEY